MNTPKERFQADPQNIKRHQALIERPEYQVGIDTAILQYTQELATSNDPNNFYRMQGAHDLVRIFNSLHTIPPRPPFEISQNLPTNR